MLFLIIAYIITQKAFSVKEYIARSKEKKDIHFYSFPVFIILTLEQFQGL